MDRYEDIIRKANGLRQKTVELRREFHQHPELPFQEFATAEKVEMILKDLGLETKRLANGTGVRGLLAGRKSGKTIALRADMDALPIQEETDVPYKSTHPGVMHACGHDAHTAMLLGAALLLAERRKDLEGGVVFLFQPAEEIGEGAKKMVEEGALDGVDAIFGLHVSSTLDSGILGYHSGPFMAAGDFFDVTIVGKGGHGGLPHLTVDPIPIAANVITSLQTIVSRETDPLENAVMSICKMEAGRGGYNIIPEKATFGGTIRTLSPELRDSFPKRMKEILNGIVPALRGSCELNIMRKFPVTINDEKMTDFVTRVARGLLGEDKVLEMRPLMACEDFSYYLQKVPGSFVFLGMQGGKGRISYPHHNPRFDVDEELLPVGTSLNVAIALDYLREGEGRRIPS
jgi:amidohydrolase